MTENKQQAPAAGGKLTGRLQSLDALRGFDMMFIMGVSTILGDLMKIWDTPFFHALHDQMHHVEWNGLAHHDTIFPLFLFIAGISWPFSYAKQQERGKTRGAIYRKIIRRGLILVLLGILYNGLLSSLDFANARYASVLGRIGLAWMFAALIYINTKTRSRAILVAVILVGYNLLCLIGSPDAPGADPLSRTGCLEGYLDRLLLPGRLNDGDFDPEGILSTLPAITTALLGMLTGEWVRRKDTSMNRKTVGLVVAGVVMLALGLAWSTFFPLNKKLWTSSFVLVVGAYSVLLFALFYYIIDVRGWRKWSFPFVVIGLNSITIYLAQDFIDFHFTTHKLFDGVLTFVPPCTVDVIYVCLYVVLCWLFLYFLYKKKVFLKV